MSSENISDQVIWVPMLATASKRDWETCLMWHNMFQLFLVMISDNTREEIGAWQVPCNFSPQIIGYITYWRTVWRTSMDYASLCDEADEMWRPNFFHTCKIDFYINDGIHVMWVFKGKSNWKIIQNSLNFNYIKS